MITAYLKLGMWTEDTNLTRQITMTGEKGMFNIKYCTS